MGQDFHLRTQDRKLAFNVALFKLMETRSLTQPLLKPLGLTQKDFRKHRTLYGPVKKQEMDSLLGHLESLLWQHTILAESEQYRPYGSGGYFF